ncbi:hypothetical protein ABFS82_12G092600 [Erythranthe guttata]
MVLAPFLAKSRPFIRLPNFKSISTFAHLCQQSQPAEPPPSQNPLPPNPKSLSSTLSDSPVITAAQVHISYGFLPGKFDEQMKSLAKMLDSKSLIDQLADWMTEHRWAEVKQLFEFWIRSLDNSGKPNKPDVNLYNHYLRASMLLGTPPGELLNIVAQMDDCGVLPNTASFNLVLKAMQLAGESRAAERLIGRMLQIGKEHGNCLPDDESYDLIVNVLLSTNQIESAIKNIDMMLKSGYMLSVTTFIGCVQTCVNNGRLDTLVSVIERCKKSDQNKYLRPPWRTCNFIADIAMQSDNSDLTYYALEFMAKWIAQGETASPSVLLSVDEGLVVSALGTAGRTYNSRLLGGSWAVLKRSLRQKKVPRPESYIAKIYAYANSGNLQMAFSTLQDFEVDHGNSNKDDGEGLFSPFYSLNPLVVACSKKGFTTLDTVYHQLENLSRADPPYKSIAALNCIILGCANIWDLDRAYQTFNDINATFGLTPNIHSYNALICAFGKLSKRDEAVKVFEHCIGLGVKPNMTTYSLLIDAHLTTRDPKAALAVIDHMQMGAGCEPSKEMLKKVRRRCVREMDYESDEKVESLARQFKIRMGTEVRRDLLFNLHYITDYS